MFYVVVCDCGGWARRHEFGSLDDAKAYMNKHHNDENGAWGTVTQTCDKCGYYGLHDFDYQPEGGFELCRHCGNYESWVR